MSQRSVCVRCGGFREGFERICPACGHRPEGDGILVAWLLSEHHLDPSTLERVSERVRAGEVIRPSAKMIRRARRALGKHWSSDPGMSVHQRAALLATSILLTPLVGWVLAIWWRDQRPRAALQALALSAPASVLFAVLVLWTMVA